MKNAVLVVMAAGIGSRFGQGIKQLEPMGPHGEIIIDYSIHDALEAGFNEVVFVIRRDLLEDFDEIIGQRIKKKVKVSYAFQELDDIKEPYKTTFAARKKPWGTGQAILACKDIVHDPFLVINADDYYGKEAYKIAYDALQNGGYSMISFVLKNTLSDNGGVTRGVCKVENGKLVEVDETSDIEKVDGKAVSHGREIPLDSLVSMNMWGLDPAFFDILEKGFDTFLKELSEEDLKSEYLLPTIIGDLLEKGEIEVNVLKSNDEWFGVTYQEDKYTVKDHFKKLVDDGVYGNLM